MPIRGHTTVAAPLGQTDESDVYATHEARRGKGGLVTGLQSIADRDAIPPERRDAGMMVYVPDTLQHYLLAPDLTTWQAVNFGTASNNLYVPTRAVSGDTALGIEDYSVYVSAKDNAVTVFLPSSAAIGNGRRYEITATDLSFAITLQAPAGELISGYASYSFGSVYDSITIESFANNWFIKGLNMSYTPSVRAPGAVFNKGNIAGSGDVPVSPANGDLYTLTADVTISGVTYHTGDEILWTGSAWEIVGNDKFTSKAVTADTTLTLYDQTVKASGASSAVAVTLPAASTAVGKRYDVKATDVTHAVTVVPDGSDTIDGATGAFTFSITNESITLMGTATGWIIV